MLMLGYKINKLLSLALQFKRQALPLKFLKFFFLALSRKKVE
jgi:hypothetical protein